MATKSSFPFQGSHQSVKVPLLKCLQFCKTLKFEIVLYIWEGTPWRRLFLYSWAQPWAIAVGQALILE